MAGGLNKAFLKDPVAFLGKYKISVNDSAMGTGPQLVGFEANMERTLLKPFIGTPKKHQHPFNCYFLKAQPDSRNLGVGFGTTTADFCFTSTLSGCQFLISGASKNALTIEHNNDLSGNGTYGGFAAASAGTAMSTQIHNGGLYDITSDDVGNVVGIRGTNGWDFYFQKIERDAGTSVKTISVTKLI